MAVNISKARGDAVTTEDYNAEVYDNTITVVII